jgi:hypothetical protein
MSVSKRLEHQWRLLDDLLSLEKPSKTLIARVRAPLELASNNRHAIKRIKYARTSNQF